MKFSRPGLRALAGALPASALLAFLPGCSGETPAEAAKAQVRPALTVTLTSPQTEDWPQRLSANGDVVAWQEAVIGAEIAGYRITEVLAQVGDSVRKGQALARIDASTIASELAEARAAVAEGEAAAAEARANAARAKELQAKGFYSQQMNTQYQTAEQGAAARLAAAQARLQAAGLRQSRTSIVAPDDGIISARSATVGSLTQPGQALFRLIRGGRLEWQAEVPAADLGRLRPGLPVQITGPAGETVTGKLRGVGPSVDPKTRNGIAYVDLPAGSAVRAGVFARGEIELGRAPARTIPQSSVVLREGFAYVFRLDGEDRVAQTKIDTGRRAGERVEILNGLPEGARIVASGAGFLTDGDRISIAAEGQK